MDKENVVHLCNAEKYNDIMNLADKWMEIENIILHEHMHFNSNHDKWLNSEQIWD